MGRVEETIPTGGITLPIGSILRVLLQRVLAIVLVIAVVTGSAVGFRLLQVPTYEASIKVLVGQNATGDADTRTDVADLQELTLTVAEAVSTVPVAQAVVERQDLSGVGVREVLENTDVEPSVNTTFINISYKDTNPERAQLIANTIGEVLSQRISEVSLGANGVTATVWAPATLPQDPASPDPVRNGVLALVFGSLLGVALAFLLEYVDDRWNSPEEVEEVSGVPNFGVVPRFETVAISKQAER